MVKHALILAGGVGTRLWPASRRQHPKQFLRLGQGQSLFAMTLRRAMGLKIEGLVCVVTHTDHVGGIVRECTEILKQEIFPPDRLLVLAEPEGRNTAPAITYACAVLRRIGTPADTLIVMPADHTIDPLSLFVADVGKAAGLAEKGWLVTFGIQPEGAETGYGYVEAAEELAPGFRVRKFKEKPDEATARSFLAQGNHYWNSGMFAFRIDRFLEELDTHSLEVAQAFLQTLLPEIPPRGSAGTSPILVPVGSALEAIYRKTPAISIDYAVMEHCEHCAVVPASFSWSDVGSWDEVAHLFGRELAARGADNLVTVDSKDNLVLADLPVALVGVQDLIVVVQNGVVLVCRKGKSQQVKDVVQKLKDDERTDLL